jgi:hypothetical protein
VADIAHDASGPASPKPGDIAPQQASRLDSPDKGKLRVFISYSREDLDFADQLAAALDSSGFECFIDREGISGGEAAYLLRIDGGGPSIFSRPGPPSGRGGEPVQT